MTESTDRDRLLLVDDDPAFCDALARALERRGFEVLKSCDMTVAYELAAEFAPEFAVVDLRLGQDSGLALVEQLVTQDPEICLVVLTGYASVASAVEAIKLGAVHYLTKPAHPDEIVAAFDRREGNPRVQLSQRPLSVRRLEWEHVQKVLQEHDGNVSAAARALGMHRRTLQRKLQKRPAKT